MSDERLAFSRRLTQAMNDAGYKPRPAVLFRLFNARYTGRSVTFQSVSRWLGGRSIPEQDKMQVLAELLGVSPSNLRFGDGYRVAEPQAEWVALGPRERAMIDTFIALPAPLRELVGELVRALAKVDKDAWSQ